MHRVASHLLGAALCAGLAAATPHSPSLATKTRNGHDDGLWNEAFMPPPPTAAPSLLDARDLALADASGVVPNATCGYISGVRMDSLTCAGVCTHNTNYGGFAVWGCCPAIVGPSTTALGNCEYQTACLDMGVPSASGQIAASCSNSDGPYCATLISTLDNGLRLTNFDCQAYSGFVLTIQSTYLGEISSVSATSLSGELTTSSAMITTTASTQTPSSPVPSGGGLSGGAKAGIGVGVSLGVILLAAVGAGAFVLWKRRKAWDGRLLSGADKSSVVASGESEDGPKEDGGASPVSSANPTSPAELGSHIVAAELPPEPRAIAELDAAVELPDNQVSDSGYGDRQAGGWDDCRKEG